MKRVNYHLMVEKGSGTINGAISWYKHDEDGEHDGDDASDSDWSGEAELTESARSKIVQSQLKMDECASLGNSFNQRPRIGSQAVSDNEANKIGASSAGSSESTSL